MNKMVIPRLIKLSSVYSGLNGQTFIWDNAEIRTAKETADLVNVLGNQFEIDPEWVEQQTGVPILGQKAAAGSTDPLALDAAKKKSLAKK